MRRGWPDARRAGVAAALLVCLSCACTWEHPVPVVLEYEAALGAGVRAFMVGVYRTESCPRLDVFTLDERDPTLVAYEFFRERRGEPLGRVEPGEYAFVALGLTEECVPWLRGCVERRFGDESFSVGDEPAVEIPMTVGVTFGAVCGPGLLCVDGACEGAE